jgi:ADP-ribose pyrophosphatase
MTDFPRIKSRRTIDISPWMDIIEREVEFTPGSQPELYYAVAQHDYITIVAMTPDGRLPIVRQYRPALEQFTWEFPAGMVDEGETAADCCRRELLEETGLRAVTVHELGCYAPCTARLSNRVHSFFVEARAERPDTEAGIELKLVTPAELGALIRSGDFVLQLHIGALLLAGLAGYVDFAAFRLPGGPAKP